MRSVFLKIFLWFYAGDHHMDVQSKTARARRWQRNPQPLLCKHNHKGPAENHGHPLLASSAFSTLLY